MLFNVYLTISGAAHIHGVLFLDLNAIEKNQIEKGNFSFKHLNSALETIANDNVPSKIEKQSINAFIQFNSSTAQQFLNMSGRDNHCSDHSLD